MSVIANYRVGRVALHVIAALRDHMWRWHIAGVRRELWA